MSQTASARASDGIRDLAVIGDRRTAALINRVGDIVWYCPGRFDQPSLFGALLDNDAGAWRLHLPGSAPATRRYLEGSGVLETSLHVSAKTWTITDFMPLGNARAGLLCRRFDKAPVPVRCVMRARPDYASAPVRLSRQARSVQIQGRWHVYASEPLHIENDTVCFDLPAGSDGWAVLADAPLPPFGSEEVAAWLAETLTQWRDISSDAYCGPYQREVCDSLRALRLLAHAESGGIVAAATTSLPEVPGGSANWDYRYAWLRDAGMIVSALVRAGGGLAEGERYLGFICSSRGSSPDFPVPVFADLDQARAQQERCLPFSGYENSQPVRIGNDARDQLQLDAYGNVLLAAKLIYQRSERRPHWDTVSAIADFLGTHWREPDHGFWEEPVLRQYTAGKVITACGLDSIAEFAPDQSQAQRWRAAVADIRAFVAEHCLTHDGAYAVYAGSDAVDVSAALFPVWAYTDADTHEMRATMAALERDYSWQGLLYWRHLECSDSRKEGAFLAATFWVAQYWVMRGELIRARRILDTALEYANDVGLFAEEADPRSRRMLGNIPQAFVHAAFMGAVIDLKTAEKTA